MNDDDELDAFLTDGFAVHEAPYDDFTRTMEPFSEAELRQIERALVGVKIAPARDLPPELDQRRRLVEAALELVRRRL